MREPRSSWGPWVLPLWMTLSICAVLSLDARAAPRGNMDETSATRERPAVQEPARNEGTQVVRNTPSTPVYAPPKRGRPRARVGGGVRGNGPKLPTLKALVPAHVARTARSRPTLLWYLSELPPSGATLMFSVTSEDEIDPLIRAELATPTKPGIQRIELSDYDFDLETGTEYEWSVALVPDADSRARDLVTLGWIERVDAVALGWIERVDEPGDLGHLEPNVSALAAAGLWYDAVDAANREERQMLLDQVGLDAIEVR